MSATYRYDAESDAAYIRFSAAKVYDSAEVSPGLIVDYDVNGKMVALEILGAADRLPEDALVAA